MSEHTQHQMTYRTSLNVILLLSVTVTVAGPGCDRNGDLQPAEVRPVPVDSVFRFHDMAADNGIVFADRPLDRDEFQLGAIMGSGCAIFDFDKNQHLDILLVARNSEHNVALFSQEAAGEFKNRTADMGLSRLSGTGVAIADCNNDGWPDIYVTSDRADSLWINEAGRSFRNITDDSGISDVKWGTAACWLDYDRDGWLDLFVSHYVAYEHRPCTRLGGGDADFCAPSLFDLTTDSLYRNTTAESPDGRISFKDVSHECGITAAASAGLGVVAKDFNGDHWCDLYVASDQHPNLLWINDNGFFTNEANLRGCDVSFQGKRQASMGLALGNVCGDGSEELIVSHLDGESHAVYSGGAAGIYLDACRETGFSTATRPLTGFGICAEDFNGDGRPEVFTANGRVRRQGPPQIGDGFWHPYQQPLQLLTSEDRHGDSTQGRFKPVSSFGVPDLLVARGLAVGDLDNDNDIDLVVSTVGSETLVLRNDCLADDDFRSVKLRICDAAVGGRSCPGAVLRFEFDGSRFERTFQPCQSYAGTHADELLIHIPISCLKATVEIIWPHGAQTPEVFDLTESSPVIKLWRGKGKRSPESKREQ